MEQAQNIEAVLWGLEGFALLHKGDAIVHAKVCV